MPFIHVAPFVNITTVGDKLQTCSVALVMERVDLMMKMQWIFFPLEYGITGSVKMMVSVHALPTASLLWISFGNFRASTIITHMLSLRIPHWIK